MKIFGYALLVASANAFMVPSSPTRMHAPTATSTATTLYASTTEASPFVQGPRIIREELPIVYVYDHCPFCVRVRLALGIKNVKHNVYFLQNDDITTPTKLIGKKIAPIFVSFLFAQNIDYGS
jgi:hypothetical protein